MMKWSFSRLFVDLCTAPALSAESMLSIISGVSLDFFLRVMDAILLYRLSFFFSSALEDLILCEDDKAKDLIIAIREKY